MSEELVVQAELRAIDANGAWITFGWFPVGLKPGARIRRGDVEWTVHVVYPNIVRDLVAERWWK